MIKAMHPTPSLSTTNWSSTIELRPPLRGETDRGSEPCNGSTVTPEVFHRTVCHKGQPYTFIFCAASVQLFDSHRWCRAAAVLTTAGIAVLYLNGGAR